MNNFSMSTTVGTPTAYITQNNKRIKQYDSSVYLADASEFQIELFNPLQTTIKATIELNGTLISRGGIVLRPAERVFLERFLDTNNKFVYSTYSVDDHGAVTKQAIKNNGSVIVKFYTDIPNVPLTDYSSVRTFINTNVDYNNTVPNPYLINCSTSTNIGCTTMASNSVNYSNTLGMNSTPTMSTNSLRSSSNNTKQLLNDGKIETGMIDKGKSSSQTFKTVNKDFSTIPFSITSWKILPLSTKPYTSGDTKLFCTNCGARIKKASFKFCPNCGHPQID